MVNCTITPSAPQCKTTTGFSTTSLTPSIFTSTTSLIPSTSTSTTSTILSTLLSTTTEAITTSLTTSTQTASMTAQTLSEITTSLITSPQITTYTSTSTNLPTTLTTVTSTLASTTSSILSTMLTSTTEFLTTALTTFLTSPDTTKTNYPTTYTTSYSTISYQNSTAQPTPEENHRNLIIGITAGSALLLTSTIGYLCYSRCRKSKHLNQITQDENNLRVIENVINQDIKASGIEPNVTIQNEQIPIVPSRRTKHRHIKKETIEELNSVMTAANQVNKLCSRDYTGMHRNRLSEVFKSLYENSKIVFEDSRKQMAELYKPNSPIEEKRKVFATSFLNFTTMCLRITKKFGGYGIRDGNEFNEHYLKLFKSFNDFLDKMEGQLNLKYKNTEYRGIIATNQKLVQLIACFEIYLGENSHKTPNQLLRAEGKASETDEDDKEIQNIFDRKDSISSSGSYTEAIERLRKEQRSLSVSSIESQEDLKMERVNS